MAVVTEEARRIARDPLIPRDDRRELVLTCAFAGSCPTQEWLDSHLHMFPVEGHFSSPDLAIPKRRHTDEFLVDELRRVPRVKLDGPETSIWYEVWWASASTMNEADHALIADPLSVAIKRIQDLWEDESCRA